MRLVAFTGLALAVASSVSAQAVQLPAREKTAYACVLKQARVETGNPMVATYAAADTCPMKGLREAQKQRIIDMTIRRLMKEYGMTCIGTGCA
jgi:hypothetical protein